MSNCRDYFPAVTSELTRLNYSLDVIIEHEGGLSTNKRDPGLVTYWGISLRFLIAAGLDLNDDGKIDENDVIGLDKVEAKSIYKEHWWDKHNYAAITDILVVSKIFDLSVNMGAYHAHRLLQIAINRINENPIKVDGIIGPVTRQSANKCNGWLLREELRKCAKHRYIEILANHPEMEWAKKGWLNRAAW